MRRLLFLSILAYALLILGLATMNSGVIVLTVLFVVYLIAALLYSPALPQLTATRAVSTANVLPHAPVTVTLTVTNHGDAIEELMIEDMLPPGLTITDGQHRVRAPLPAGSSLELTYTAEGTRGDFRFRTVRVTVSDVLGLFRRSGQVDAPGHVLVMPEPLQLQHITIRPLRTRGYAGPIPARIGGSGVDFFGVREYRMGDPMRWINWRTSARHPRAIFTNEFEQERIADVAIILDARQQTDVVMGGDSLFEYSVRATAALAEAFLSDGNRVGLLVYGRGLETTHPGYGKVQRERIMRALAYARTGSSLVFDSLDYLPARAFPAQSQIVFVSPLRAEDVRVLVRLRAHGYQVLVVSPDPVTFEAKHLEASPTIDLAMRITRLERLMVLRKLRRVGIQVVDWQVKQSFDKLMRASLVRPPNPSRIVRIAR